MANLFEYHSPMDANRWKKSAMGAGLFLGLLALLAFPKFLPIARWLEVFTGFVKDHGAAGYLYFALAYILGTVLFFPGALLTLAAGVAFGFVKGTILSLTSATLGAACSFLLGRYFLRGRIEKHVRSNPRFVAFDEAIAKQGGRIVLLLRLSPLIPFNFSNYFFGITKIGFGSYFVLSFIGMLPGTMLYVYLGHIGHATLEGKHDRSAFEYVFLGLGLVATVALTWVVGRMAKHALNGNAAKSKM